MESTSLVAIPGSRLPEMLGNFHLDNHHVEEWSDPAGPGLKHRARKEVGKWVNVEKNADIHYQKQEDSQQSDRSQERSRTEVIKGKAPDSTFQVVRSHRQYQDGDENSGSKMQETSCTSYHVSSSRGVRSTTKTTSNKTTTKTVTVSGGRADDFENLRMSFTPLDTSTQRERISVSRSGTMGIRRPPTRRHTPAALICSSPESGPEAERPEDGQVLVDSDDNLRDTPDPGKLSEQSGISIVGFKNISPKIRVGFPVEIQLELQTKLRSSSTLEKDHHQVDDTDEIVNFEHGKETDKPRGSRAIESSSVSSAIPLGGLSSVNSRDSSFDFRERRKSFLSENFESSSKENQHGSIFGNVNLRRSSLHQYGSSRTRDTDDEEHQQSTNHRNSIAGFLNQSHTERPTEMSWDLIQNVQMRPRAEHISKMYSTLSSDTSSGEEYVQSQYKFNDGENTDPEMESRSTRYEENKKESFTQRLKTINTTNGNKKTVVTLNASQQSLNYDKKNRGYEHDDSSLEIENQDPARMSVEEPNDDYDYQHHHHHHHHHHNDTNVVSTPDVLHHENSSSTSLSPSLERSRKLLKMLDETPDLLNKMSFRSYFSSADKPEVQDWEEEKDEMDWETQRQLSFLNDSLSRILDETRSIDSIGVDKDMAAIMNRATAQSQGNNGLDSNNATNSLWNKLHHEVELDYNGNFKEMQLGKMSQVSQTWISSVDHKPSQTVRDNDVVTSISATNDAYKKGPKKVEFCKTEVHFTPDSGRFNIVETDENKPSTAHLFRRKKRSEKKSSSASSSSQQVPAPVSPYSSSSSMSSLDSTTDKNETAYILEMQVENDTKKKKSEKTEGEVNILFSTSQVETRATKQNQKKEENRSKVHIGVVPDSFQSQWEKSVKKVHGLMEVTASKMQSSEDLHGSSHDIHSLPVLTSSCSKSGSDKSVANNYNESNEKSSSRVLINLDNIDNEDYEDDIRSPSHTILSNYGEMKIQRYLKQLKLPGSREGSSSPVGSPTSHDTDEDGHFRFDNILYENGSFVPLATRRSLIEMNNRNRKRLNAAASQSSDNSSTTSTYSLPNSDKDNNYSALRLGSVEAVVSTDGSTPQITSVEFRYTNGRPGHPEPDEKTTTPAHDLDYHSLSVKERRERFSSVPSPVMPHDLNMRSSGRHPIAMSPTESHPNDSRPSSSAYLSKKPPTPILPVQFTTFERTGAELRERFYAKNNTNMCVSSCNEVNDSTTTSSRHHGTRREGKLASKSVVTISGDEANEKTSEEIMITTTTLNGEDNEPLSPEPVLSLDHTWKGPAHYENQEDTSQKKCPRSLTYPKSTRTEPEWVSKAKSREARVTDWSLIEKQQQQGTLSRNTEPPWISEIRFRNKPIPTEELKSLPKVSVVYPWQRDSSSKESSVDRTDLPEEESHIVSIVPEPPMNSTLQREDKRAGSYDLYSGKSLPPIKSLKSVPEVSIAGRKNKSIVEVNSEPENYITGSQKYQLQTKKETMSSSKAETLSKLEKKSTSMRIISERASTVEEEIKREVETMPKKSRKQLHSTPTSKEAVREGYRSVEKSKTQPRPPKPPQRVTSVGRETKSRETTLMTVPPFRESSRQQRERVSGSSSTNYGSTVRKSRSKKSDIDESPLSSGANTPVHHRHPTIQISKLPMKTSKVSVVDGKRFSSGSGSKSKTKHLVTSTPSKGEILKPKSPTSSNPPAPTSSRDREAKKSSRRPDPTESNSKTYSGHSNPLKTSTRSPSDSESKKRKSTVSSGQQHKQK